MSPLLQFALAFGLALLLVPVLRRVAFATGVVAKPAANRWHRQPIPLLGGVALVTSVWITLGVAGGFSRPTFIVLMGASILSAVGLVDDLRPLRPATKLAWQILVAAGVVALDLRLGLSSVVALDLGLTVLWLVALSNAFNLLDNMDGLAAGIGAIALFFRLIFLDGPANADASYLVIALLGASLGFLVFNFAPARIFMGDAGSLFLGFAVAGASLVGEWPYSRAVSATLFLPVLLTAVPLFDATFVTVARTLAGRPVYVGGRDHTSHRLVALGLTERSAVLFLYLLATLGGGVAYTSYRYGWSYGGVLSGLFLLGLLILGTFLSRSVKPHEEPERMNALTGFIETSDLGWLRGLATVLVDATLVVAAWYSAFLLKFDDALGAHMPLLLRTLPQALAVHIAWLMVMRAPQQLWRFIGLPDLIRLGEAAAGATAVMAVLFWAEGLLTMSLVTVLVIHLFVVLGMLAATRLSFRVLSQYLAESSGTLEPILVYGAGHGGVMALREIRENRALGWQVVGFLDDDPSKHRTRVQGVPVLGGSSSLEEHLTTRGIRRVVISSPKIDERTVDDVVQRCRPFGSEVLRAEITFR